MQGPAPGAAGAHQRRLSLPDPPALAASQRAAQGGGSGDARAEVEGCRCGDRRRSDQYSVKRVTILPHTGKEATMAVRTRKDAWKLNPWDDTFLWYARAVGAMLKRKIADPTSWRYQAAIHEYQRATETRCASRYDRLPPGSQGSSRYWTQCQHKQLVLLPWHRWVSLWYFEGSSAAGVVKLEWSPRIGRCRTGTTAMRRIPTRADSAGLHRRGDAGRLAEPTLRLEPATSATTARRSRRCGRRPHLSRRAPATRPDDAGGNPGSATRRPRSITAGGRSARWKARRTARCTWL